MGSKITVAPDWSKSAAVCNETVEVCTPQTDSENKASKMARKYIRVLDLDKYNKTHSLNNVSREVIKDLSKNTIIGIEELNSSLSKKTETYQKLGDLEKIAMLDEVFSRVVAYAHALAPGDKIIMPEDFLYEVKSILNPEGFQCLILANVRKPEEIKVLFRGTDPHSFQSIFNNFSRASGSAVFATYQTEIFKAVVEAGGGKELSIGVHGHSQGGALAQYFIAALPGEMITSHKEPEKPGLKAKKIELGVWNSPAIDLEQCNVYKQKRKEFISEFPATEEKESLSQEFRYHKVKGDPVQQCGERYLGSNNLADTATQFTVCKYSLKNKTSRKNLRGLAAHTTPVLMEGAGTHNVKASRYDSLHMFDIRKCNEDEKNLIKHILSIAEDASLWNHFIAWFVLIGKDAEALTSEVTHRLPQIRERFTSGLKTSPVQHLIFKKSLRKLIILEKNKLKSRSSRTKQINATLIDRKKNIITELQAIIEQSKNIYKEALPSASEQSLENAFILSFQGATLLQFKNQDDASSIASQDSNLSAKDKATINHTIEVLAELEILAMEGGATLRGRICDKYPILGHGCRAIIVALLCILGAFNFGLHAANLHSALHPQPQSTEIYPKDNPGVYFEDFTHISRENIPQI